MTIKLSEKQQLTWHFSSATLNCFSLNATLASLIKSFISFEDIAISELDLHWFPAFSIATQLLTFGVRIEVMIANAFVNNETTDDRRNTWHWLVTLYFSLNYSNTQHHGFNICFVFHSLAQFYNSEKCCFVPFLSKINLSAYPNTSNNWGWKKLLTWYHIHCRKPHYCQLFRWKIALIRRRRLTTFTTSLLMRLL